MLSRGQALGHSRGLWEILRCSILRKGAVTTQLELTVAMEEYGPCLARSSVFCFLEKLGIWI